MAESLTSSKPGAIWWCNHASPAQSSEFLLRYMSICEVTLAFAMQKATEPELQKTKAGREGPAVLGACGSPTYS